MIIFIQALESIFKNFPFINNTIAFVCITHRLCRSAGKALSVCHFSLYAISPHLLFIYAIQLSIRHHNC